MVNISLLIMLEGMRADFLPDRQTQPNDSSSAPAKRNASPAKPRLGTDFIAKLSSEAEMAQDQRHHHQGKMGQPPRRRDFHLAAEQAMASSSWMAWSVTISANGTATLKEKSPHDRSEKQPDTLGLHSENKELRGRFQALHQHRRKQQSSRRIRGRHQHRLHPRHREYFAGRKDSGDSTSPLAIPYAEHTGQNWISKTHIDCVGRDFDIWFDDDQVMQGGKFLV